MRTLSDEDLDSIEKTEIIGSTFDVRFSNSICFPEIKLGFHHFIHKTKDKMEAVEEFANRKKIYLVTSLFEKNIDYKEKTDSGVNFTSIDNGIKLLIKSIILIKLRKKLEKKNQILKKLIKLFY